MTIAKPLTAKNEILSSRRLARNYHVWKLPCLALWICCVTVGCNGQGKGPQRAAARGTVSVDGEPLENGMVQFTPTGGNSGPVAGAVITHGEYSVSRKLGPVIGTNRLEIIGNRKTGRKTKTEIGMIVDEYETVVPPHYNAQSTMVREVKEGDNVFDFALSSDGSTE